MGGPCRLETGGRLRKAGPACTDNFQVRPFEFQGATYHSCEQAYQALKYEPGSQDRDRVAAIRPNVGETDSAHGMRCWNAGQVCEL